MSGPNLQVHGRAAKRGLIPRLPSGDRLLADAEEWLRAEYPETVRAARRHALADGSGAELVLSLHPVAPPVSVRATDEGEVRVAADTFAAGPGYHTFTARLVERLGDGLEIAWTPPGGADGDTRDETGYFPAGTRQTVERAYLGWLGRHLTAARDAARRGRRGIHLATPPGVRFITDAVLVTPLGPRDEAWLDSALADPHVALDIVPWWADATDARYLLNAALALMWTDVRWRPPATQDERAVLDEVARLLWRAMPLDPSLPYPWREWLAVLDFRGVDDAAARQVAPRAAPIPEDTPQIGYRRGDVLIVHEGWSLELPGSYTEQRTDEEWTGGGEGRSITIAATATGSGGRPMSAEQFLAQVAGDLGPDALTHRDGPVLGRARIRTDATSGVEIGVLEGFSAVSGSGAAIRIEFDDPADWQWAIDTWRALAPA